MSVKNGINGWAGSVLRVNLTTGAITTEDTLPKYKPYIGGMGLGYKVIWDEVPLDSDPLGPAAKAVFAIGPLTASGVPCSGRMNVSFLSCWSKGYSIVDAHMGGHFAHALKYAGYDAVIVEGQSDKPVYLKIEDEKVSIEDASDLWGKGTFETNATIAKACGPEFDVCCIGPAGENLVPMSCMVTSFGNSGGGGVGAVLGSKKLKAIACRGTGAVKIARPMEVRLLSNYMIKDLVGGNKGETAFYDRLCAMIGVPKEDCVMFEDSLYAMQGARAAGLSVVGITDSTNAHVRAQMQDTCDIVIDSYDELA